MKTGETTFIEQDCTINHDRIEFTSGGSWIGRHRGTGKLGGLFYAYPNEQSVGTWHGDEKVSARFGREWRSCFGDVRQSVYFSWRGVRFYGVYYKSGSDMVRATEIRQEGTR